MAAGRWGTSDGNVIGYQAQFSDNTPNGATVGTDQLIADWEAIQLAPDVAANNVLPGGRALVVDPTVVPQPGQQVCHFGVVTGESCGTVDAVNNGWFTMANGVVSEKGDSGGPVYVLTDDGRAAIIGMFNSTWGQFPAAVLGRPPASSSAGRSSTPPRQTPPPTPQSRSTLRSRRTHRLRPA